MSELNDKVDENDPQSMRLAITELAYRGAWRDDSDGRHFDFAAALARRVLDYGKYRGLSGEDTMTMLAYHALKQYEAMAQRVLEFVNASPAPPIVIAKAAESPEGRG